MRKLPLLGFAAVAATLLACAGVDDGTTQGPGVDAGGATAGNTGADDGSRSIVFEVTGDGVNSANSITYGVGGNSSQANDAALPWSKTSTSTESFLLLSLVAQSGSSGGGSISCKITVDGKVVVENTSQGGYAVVTCSGSD